MIDLVTIMNVLWSKKSFLLRRLKTDVLFAMPMKQADREPWSQLSHDSRKAERARRMQEGLRKGDPGFAYPEIVGFTCVMYKQNNT